MSKPSLPQGTRDFGPDVVRKRTYILNTIRNVFELYGFQPLETPAMENIETLMGKYGEEGDKLIFKILNNGLDNADKEKLASSIEFIVYGNAKEKKHETYLEIICQHHENECYGNKIQNCVFSLYGNNEGIEFILCNSNKLKTNVFII